MTYRRVGLVDKLDVIKNVSSYFITCLELFSLDAFALQQPQDALLYCIVMALIPSAHAGCGHQGTYASSAATVTAGLVAGATEKSAGTDWRSGWIRVPGRHSEAIGKSDQIDDRPFAQTDVKRDCCGMKRRFILPVSQVPVSKSSYIKDS